MASHLGMRILGPLLALGLLAPSLATADLEQIRAAAERGDAEKQLELGELYEFGFSLPGNAVPALAWYMIAADQGSAKAAQRRDLLKSRLAPEQVAEAERLRAVFAAPQAVPVSVPESAPAPAVPASPPEAPAAPAAPAAVP